MQNKFKIVSQLEILLEVGKQLCVFFSLVRCIMSKPVCVGGEGLSLIFTAKRYLWVKITECSLS